MGIGLLGCCWIGFVFGLYVFSVVVFGVGFLVLVYCWW